MLLLLGFVVDLIAISCVVGATLVAIASFTVVEIVWWLTCSSVVLAIACDCDCDWVVLSMRIGIAGVVVLGVVAIGVVLPTAEFIPSWSVWSSLSTVVNGRR